MIAAVSPVSAPVTAIVLAHSRPETTLETVDRLQAIEPVREILVVDTGSMGIAAMADARGGKARGVRTADIGIGGRNAGAREASHELLVMLDDDSWPLPGAVERLAAALEANPGTAVAGGLVRNVDPAGDVLTDTRVGSFDWWLRAGRPGDGGPAGLPAFFFPEGGCMVRRTPFLEVGGFFEPYHFAAVEMELTTRLVGAGWDVRYVPDALFDHLRAGPEALVTGRTTLHYRIRNQLWYFWLRFPAPVAARRIVAYGLFDLLEAAARGHPGAWLPAVREAWRERERVRPFRAPLPRAALRRAELNRGRRHLAWLAHQVWSRLSRRGPAASR
jgi:GT2 family glycosyltransferase